MVKEAKLGELSDVYMESPLEYLLIQVCQRVLVLGPITFD